MAIPKAFLEELEKKRAAARAGGGEDKLEARRKKCVMTARDRLKELFLVTLEAMKMNTFVFAPKSGKVAEIQTAVGSAVQEGQSLVRIA